ncbi:hypothetical protein Rumeso_02724 [Rubellimicrobium mesophilum DSM 19309]|uniref:Uncharacterized protein n=1 Tax=Rubellimicrobium mesophilum DSM 19309 TaxID=442562 RepID=A0A017HMC2_9RHOB|nr:hypothetical protein [Rubellimicrobium mesophilum]EYD75637.1 hypothetical protein Rumeso_02724 [Rubellimicrobium mesophilum DSM 19309]
MTMPRILHILLIVVLSMPMWGLPYGVLVAALIRLLFEGARVQWQAAPGAAMRLG